MPAVPVEEARRFMQDCLQVAGAPHSAAASQAGLLLHADCTGHFSHGINRLEMYVNDFQSGATDPLAVPYVLKEGPATAWVDGANGLGAVVAGYCMDLAVKKARIAGVGWVSAKNCNHFGMAGYWAKKAEEQGLIGMAFTNSSPIMVPTRSKERCLGTNPISLAAPAIDGDSLVVDMAMTTVAMGKIEVQIHKGEPLPEGWALGPDGKVTTDAQKAFDTGRLLPLGGFESTSGHKGYGLASMTEVFCSGLSGSNPSHRIGGWTFDAKPEPPNLGQCFAAIDPGHFAPGFAERIADCLTTWRGLEPVDQSLPVLAPGDKEVANMTETLDRGTIIYVQKQMDNCHALAERLGVPRIMVL